ncbi:MAG: 23S rRNA (adenine(1618)-N(6))-methyltransferase RlmF [Saprospiraceae bacterium]
MKEKLHPRSRHRAPYDFEVLTKVCPALTDFLRPNPRGQQTIDFANPTAVKLLNKALLLHFYDLSYWDIPAGYLCPPIPGRADYLHYIADLLAKENNGKIPKGKSIHGLDIGLGANAIYPIIGQKEYAWSFVGTEVDLVALENAKRIRKKNAHLKTTLAIRQQTNTQHIFQTIIQPQEYFDFTLCNPPFHASKKEAQASALRKVKNLQGKAKAKNLSLNFGGQARELYYSGGELAFIKKMIQESKQFSTSCYWFTSLVSKQANLPAIQRTLQAVKAQSIEIITMEQGNKKSRIVAWSFLHPTQRKAWRKLRWT